MNRARKGLGSPFYDEEHIVFYLQLHVLQRESHAYAFLQRQSCSAPPALVPPGTSLRCACTALPVDRHITDLVRS